MGIIREGDGGIIQPDAPGYRHDTPVREGLHEMLCIAGMKSPWTCHISGVLRTGFSCPAYSPFVGMDTSAPAAMICVRMSLLPEIAAKCAAVSPNSLA